MNYSKKNSIDIMKIIRPKEKTLNQLITKLLKANLKIISYIKTTPKLKQFLNKRK